MKRKATAKPAAAPEPAGVLICRWCERQVVETPGELRRSVLLSGAIMHGDCYADMRAKTQRMIDEAIAAGRHSTAPPPSPPESTYQRSARLAGGCDYSREHFNRKGGPT